MRLSMVARSRCASPEAMLKPHTMMQHGLLYMFCDLNSSQDHTRMAGYRAAAIHGLMALLMFRKTRPVWQLRHCNSGKS